MAHLKSSMDRFIGSCNPLNSIHLANLKSSMDRFIEHGVTEMVTGLDI